MMNAASLGSSSEVDDLDSTGFYLLRQPKITTNWLDYRDYSDLQSAGTHWHHARELGNKGPL